MDENYKKGIKLALLTALISGFAVFINKFGVGLWGNAYAYTTAKNIISAMLLIGVVVTFNLLPEIKSLSKKQWIRLILIGLIGGSIPFLLFFKSLTLISAPQAAFIHKTLFIWVALLAYPFLKERLSWIQIGALGMLLLGVFLFISPSSVSISAGTLMAFVATILWAIENIIAKIALKDLSAYTVAWARMFIGSIFLVIFLMSTGNMSGLLQATLPQTLWAIAVGATLFGYVTTWYSALKLAPATVVSSILVIAPPITVMLNSIFITRAFPSKIIIPTIVLVFGVYIISSQLLKISGKLISLKSETKQ